MIYHLLYISSWNELTIFCYISYLFLLNKISLIIQATPPFVVVHTNSAYTALAGIQSHYAAAKPIAQILALKPNTNTKGAGQQQHHSQSRSSMATTMEFEHLIGSSSSNLNNKNNDGNDDFLARSHTVYLLALYRPSNQEPSLLQPVRMKTKMSISPVIRDVNSSDDCSDAAVKATTKSSRGTNKKGRNHGSKKKKRIITHYLLQLQRVSNDSSSSSSSEAEHPAIHNDLAHNNVRVPVIERRGGGGVLLQQNIHHNHNAHHVGHNPNHHVDNDSIMDVHHHHHHHHQPGEPRIDDHFRHRRRMVNGNGDIDQQSDHSSMEPVITIG